MDVLRRLSRDGAIRVVDDKSAERQRLAVERLAVIAVARWASSCLGHDDLETGAYERRTLAAFDHGDTADRIVTDIGSEIELAGKPSLAGIASVVFAQAMDGAASPIGVRSHGRSSTTVV